MGFLQDLLHGKEKTYKRDELADGINSTAKSGMDMITGGANKLNEKIFNNAEGFVNNQIDVENRLLRNASEDAGRRTRQLIAQRGMGSSSIGLGEEINQRQTLNDKLALNNASGFERLKGLYNEQMQTGNQLLAPKLAQGPMQMQDIKQRTGGIAPLIQAAGQVGSTIAAAKLGKT